MQDISGVSRRGRPKKTTLPKFPPKILQCHYEQIPYNPILKSDICQIYPVIQGE